MNQPDLRQSLEELRDLLLSVRPDPSAKPVYEGMSDALRWPDETGGIVGKQIWVLRIIWHYRTGLIIGEDRAHCAAQWHIAQDVLSGWIGFLPERCRPDSGFAAIYHAGANRFKRQIRSIK